MTSVCSKCGEEKPKSEFSPHKTRASGVQSWCKSCNRARYHSNPKYREAAINRNKKSRARYRLERTSLLHALKDKPCTDCGVKYPPYVMDFDHSDPSEKLFDISKGWLDFSWEKVLEEVDKCELVCANCHRERTHGSVAERQCVSLQS